MNNEEIPVALIDLLRKAQRVGVLTGAGTSAESGVPTFRDAQTGLWADYDFKALATPEAFWRNPALVWEWYTWRRELVMLAKPNPGHFALVAMQAQVSELTVITQNVDGMHQRAGHNRVIELHGNLIRHRCANNGYLVENWPATVEVPPPCPHCGGPLRPDVVWFGEPLPAEALDQAIAILRKSDVVLSVGTSSVVQPAASLPFEALESGAKLVEINPNKTPLTPYAHFALFGKSGEILPDLVKQAWPSQLNSYK
jgi:NAD-dependent deacetylase